jgi:hypothetical protein
VVAGNRGPIPSPLSGGSRPFIGICGIHGIHQQLKCLRLKTFTKWREMTKIFWFKSSQSFTSKEDICFHAPEQGEVLRVWQLV